MPSNLHLDQDPSIKAIAILGSTGSIGTQALEVIAAHPSKFKVEVLTAQNNASLLIQQALRFNPNCVVITEDAHYKTVKDALAHTFIKVFSGAKNLEYVVTMGTVDIVLTALVGFAGLAPTLAAINAKKPIALANKETLVVAGELVTAAAKANGVNIYPVDSEHSAIFQCLAGEWHNPIYKLILTASGGPFLGATTDYLANVTVAQALKHPNWAMGAKISIDSATLMNKGLEVIEAKWLFGVPTNRIDVVVHPQSIIHSMVEFEDGSLKAQLGLPDMRLPIQYALGYPDRLPNSYPRFNFSNYPQLTFQAPDMATFPNLQHAFTALDMGGTAPCILNAANEITVKSFLEGKIKFNDIARINGDLLNSNTVIISPTIEDYYATDEEIRWQASAICGS